MKLRRLLLRVGFALAVVLAAVLLAAWLTLRASLPSLDGRAAVHDIRGSISIERDALGIPTILATNRADLAYATGFVHGQDRFFQMDLSRRLAAAELAPLFGAVGAKLDARARPFGFRRVAREVFDRASPEEQALVTAYTKGANAGLESLKSRPWEYWALRAKPAPWREEDTFLVVYAMWLDLQYGSLHGEIVRRQINARLPGPILAKGWKRVTCFLYPNQTDWDAPNDARGGASLSEPPAEFSACNRLPGPQELDLRAAGARVPGRSAALMARACGAVGSNNWAVAGKLTAGGAALVANDMHLSLRIPATWYRVRLRLQSGGHDAATHGLDLNGLMLPGAPVLVAGSNHHIAWGFTNSYGSWFDVAELPCDSKTDLPKLGPVADVANRCWFANWLASSPESTNLHLLAFERAHSVAQVLALAPTVGIPEQNLIVGDAQGHIAWTIAGRVPRGEHPQIIDPPSGLLWSANAVATDSAPQQLAIGGDAALVGANYDLAARARQIRDDLRALSHPATPADMLAIQLDDRAVFLERWRQLLWGLLDEAALRNHPDRMRLRQALASWNRRASVNSVSYRMVREFRSDTEAALWAAILESLRLNPTDAPPPARFEQPMWTILSAQAPHLLPGPFRTWREFLLARVDEAISRSKAQCGDLSSCTWGRRNIVTVRHPLSNAMPFLASLLDMPILELPGDHNMPRVQDGTAFGASERFAVTPGREAEGYLDIAGGQSGHPLSPYYRRGFREWAEGRPLPFLPGPMRHRFVLEPAKPR